MSNSCAGTEVAAGSGDVNIVNAELYLNIGSPVTMVAIQRRLRGRRHWRHLKRLRWNLK